MRRPGSFRRCAIEGLESRVLFHLEVTAPINNIAVSPGTNETDINLSEHFDNEDITGTIVRLNTDLGAVDLQMLDSATPVSVANFLGYVNRGDYNNTFFHRSIANFVVQGGGYSASTIANPVHITEQAPIVNEFSPTRSNVRTTVAMAKLAGDPNSATSEFFFNLEDNSSNLNNQNGGFTVFANVINNTMTVVDTIAGLQTFNPPQVVFQDLPLQSSPPATVDNLVKINTAVVIPETALFNFAVQSSDPGLVTPIVTDGVLKLSYAPGGTGSATITVTATDVNGTSAQSTFVAGIGSLDVAIGNGGAKAATFTDADGTTATVSLKGGSGTLHFSGSNLSQNAGKGGAVVLGTINDLSVDLTGTASTGALTVKASGGDGLITFQHLTSDGGMKSIAAKQVNLTGNLTIAGNVAKADFADVSNSVMTFGGAGGSLALSLRNATAVDIVSQIGIKTLKAATFATGGESGNAISAPTIGSLTITGDFNERLDVAGSLGNAKIGGAVNTFLPWNIGGGAGKLSIGTNGDGFVADFGGPIASLAVAGALSADVSAASIKSLTVKGDMSGANLVLTGGGVTLNKATISGSIANSRIQASNSSIGSITAAAINASTIYASVSTDGGILPTDTSDFSGAGAIASVNLKGLGGAPSFVNANIAAPTLGKINLGVIQAGNAGVPFGIAADIIASVSGTGVGPIKLSKLTDAAQSTTQQDFAVRVF